MRSLLLVLVAHLLVDFAFKTEQMRLTKSEIGARGAYVRHGLLVWIMMWLAIIWSQGLSWRALYCTWAIAGVHIFVDLAKYLALRNESWLRQGLTAIFLDCHKTFVEFLIHMAAQLLHVAALCFLLGLVYPPRFELEIFAFTVRGHLMGATAIPERDLILYLTLLFLMGTVGGARVIQFIERAFYPGNIPDITDKKEWVVTSGEPLGMATTSAKYSHVRTEEQCTSPPGRPGVSYWLGILERLLIMLCPLVPAMGITAGAVVGAKAVVRYNQFKHQAFSEYVLCGTFASLIWGITFAGLVSLALM
ncbi:MAG: hypothetical protein K0R39_3567 [Symbiobacteriaceae bacterium]|jgi:hypothetical protein|nr:hypothetical protein [Symbiobacteriaceae bacterium]